MGEVVLGLTRSKVELVLNLDFQDAAAPAVGKGLADVEIAGGGVFQLLHDLEDVPPGQLRNRLLRNWTIREFAGEYFHRQQVARDNHSLTVVALIVVALLSRGGKQRIVKRGQ